MKKIVLGLSMIMGITAFGQTEKGNVVIAGSTSLNFNSLTPKVKISGATSEGDKTTTLSFTPSIGYFIIDNLALNLDMNLTSMTQKGDNYKDTTTAFSFLPGATYYFNNNSKFIPYLGANIGYGTMKYSETYNNNTVDSDKSGFTWKVKGGGMYMVTNSLAVDLGLGYSQFSTSQEVNSIKATTTLNNFGVNLGMAYFIKSKKRSTEVENN